MLQIPASHNVDMRDTRRQIFFKAKSTTQFSDLNNNQLADQIHIQQHRHITVIGCVAVVVVVVRISMFSDFCGIINIPWLDVAGSCMRLGMCIIDLSRHIK